MLEADHSTGYLYPRTCKFNIGESFPSNQDICFSVPQGSLCGPVQYNSYVTTMTTLVPPAIAIHAYADNHAFKKEFNSFLPKKKQTLLNLSATARIKSRNG